MQNVRILVIEDDELLRDIYHTILTDEGYATTVVSNGQDGLSEIKNNTWDLVLLDIYMPHMTGLELLTHLAPAVDRSSIVLMTNRELDAQLQQAIRSVGGYIIKSAHTPDSFLKEVKRFLNTHKASRA